MERKWRNIELKDPTTIYEVRSYCIRRKKGNRRFMFETSDAGYGYTHFEIFCTEGEANGINRLIEEVDNTKKQPEIIYCKDCRYRNEGIYEGGTPVIKCFHKASYGERHLNDFCSWAERK